MAKLKTTFAGLELDNPIVVSSAGITESVEKMRRCQDNGAAAIVMKSYFEEEICRQNPSPRYRVLKHDMGTDKTFTFMSYEQASEWDIDRYAEEIARAKDQLDIKIIPSINCLTTEGWAEAARKVTDAGADALELNTSCPHASITFRGGAVEDTISRTVEAVRNTVDIPLVAKISPMLTSPLALVTALEKVGVDGVTIFNRMTGLDIDLEAERPALHGGYAGHGGPWAIQYPLRWISEISRNVKLDIAGSGGVTNGTDAVKYLLAGAQVVQICSVVVLNGYEAIGEVVSGLSQWMDQKGYRDLKEFRGRAARGILGTQEVDRTQKFAAHIHRETVAPCVYACPAHVPAQAYVHRIAERDFAGALEAIRSAGPLQSVCGWVCYHPCESECTRANLDEAIAIRALKRFAIEWGRKHMPLSEAPIEKADPTGKRIAVVGSGPAGLTAAHDLARMGHQVTIFEAADEPGGMLRWAIPLYRLPRGIVDEEVDYVRRFGVDIQCGKSLGRDLTLDSLDRECDAVVLAFGTGQSARLGVPGENVAGVVGALAFLQHAASDTNTAVGKRVAVIGGGGSAMDTACTALRCGADEVFVVYRRTRAEMPIDPEHVEQAEQEGVHVLTMAIPVGVESKSSRVTGLRVRGAFLDKPEPGRRRAPVPVEDIEYVLKVDQIIVAVSQMPDEAAVKAGEGVAYTPRGTIEVLNEFGTTSRAGIFAAGDVTGLTGSIIEAIGSGRRTALAVDSHLAGKGIEDARERWGDWRVADKRKVIARSVEQGGEPRVRIPQRDAVERVRDFDEIEFALSEERAVHEAGRCLRCGCGVGCELCRRICPYDAVVREGVAVRVDTELCSGCGLCIERCPLANIDTVPVAKK